MKKINLLLVAFFCLFAYAKAQGSQIISPDGKLMVTVSVNNGTPTYSINYNGKPFLKPSPLGMKTNVGDLSEGLTISDKVEQTKIDETYELPNIKQSKVNYVATEGVFSFLKDNKAAFNIIFRVSNNDVAFQYKVLQQGQRQVCIVNQETTGFVLRLCPNLAQLRNILYS